MYTRSLYRLLSFLLLVILVSACGGAKNTVTASEEPPVLPGKDISLLPDVYHPSAGTVMEWVDGSKVVYIPAGELNMGEGSGSENAPAHNVSLNGFWIHQSEVTNRMYKRCVSSGTCTEPSIEGMTWYGDLFYADYPVVAVNWNQAQVYCTWAQTTLPSEAQWEMAAAGPDHNLYPWGDIAPACDLLNFDNCLNPPQPDLVGSYAMGVSTFGLFDMGGNVFEWVADYYSPDFYLASPGVDPTGPASGETHVVRGGAYDSPELLVRTSTRGALDTDLSNSNVGFRCIVTEDRVVHKTLPVCQVAAYLPPAETTSADVTPESTGNASFLDGYCDNDGASVGINIDVGEPVDNPDDYVVTVAGEKLTCINTPGYPNRLTCYGASVTQDHTVTATICPAEGDSEGTTSGTPVCDPGYVYNPATGFCQYTPVPQTEGSCPSGYAQDESGTCLPEPDSTGNCPIGYFPYGINGNTVCVPPEGTDPNCTFGLTSTTCEATCLPGYTYDPTLQCCQAPQEILYECPQNYTYSKGAGICVPDGSTTSKPACTTSSVYIPSCQTPWVGGNPDPCRAFDEYNCRYVHQAVCEWVGYTGGYCRTR